jgi:hypothetical protein
MRIAVEVGRWFDLAAATTHRSNATNLLVLPTQQSLIVS